MKTSDGIVNNSIVSEVTETHLTIFFSNLQNGIQTLMMELPMTMNGRSVSCVVQYVIFPPHSSTGSSNMSTWSEEDNFDTASTLSSVDKNSVTEDESVQIISEVWIEPQDGVVTKEVNR